MAKDAFGRTIDVAAIDMGGQKFAQASFDAEAHARLREIVQEIGELASRVSMLNLQVPDTLSVVVQDGQLRVPNGASEQTLQRVASLIAELVLREQVEQTGPQEVTGRVGIDGPVRIDGAVQVEGAVQVGDIVIPDAALRDMRDVIAQTLAENKPYVNVSGPSISRLRNQAGQQINPATEESVSGIPDLTGTWGYQAGTTGTLAMTGSKRLLKITCYAADAAASLSINGGDSITIPADSGLTIEPHAQLVDPSLTFSNTDSYFVEYLTG